MKKSLLFAAGFALAVMPVAAQRLAEGYITMPSSSALHTYVQAWNNGAGKITMDGKEWEDEEFFTSRVKPKDRFTDASTQVRTDLGGRRYMNWIPVGNSTFNALPNAQFDSETFTMWSYIDHWGNWTSPYGWQIGAFADAAHKNGVGAGSVAATPNASMPSGWATCFESLISQGGDKLGKFMYYHGCDGLGYNSEWTGWAPKSKGLTTLHQNLYTYMANVNHKNPVFENFWYNGVTDGGSLSFDHLITAANSSALIQGTSMFLNYNWDTKTHKTTSVDYVKSIGKDPYKCLYAGMNQEGSSSTGAGGNGSQFADLSSQELSFGVWGSHNWNAFWRDHGQGGTTPQALQRKYMNDTEGYYTGASRNPAVRLTLKNTKVPTYYDDWAGVSALVSARSVLSWNLANEPFYTFFNVGNGTFFNWKGERVSNTEWYNLGVQDYLPTWRFWFAPTLLANNIQASQVHMNAQFTWDDAYVGGSCLKVSGSTTSEYLHLFKTNFALPSKDKIVLKYKLLGGKGKVSLVGYGYATTSSKDYSERTYEIFNLDNCEDIEDASYAEGADGWQTLEVKLANGNRLAGGMKLLGLKFENTENLEMLIGGLWFEKDGTTFATPNAPTIKLTKVLANSYAGVDAKLVWTMDGDAGRNAGVPTYNSDVNTSMFKVYSQEQGGDVKFICATTSWAAIAFQCPNTDNATPIRFGVSAVSMDTKSESAITWSDYKTKPAYTCSEDIELDKKIIKPQESFSVYFVDQLHPAVSMELKDVTGKTVASTNGTRLDVPNGLDQGGYDLVVAKGTANERTVPFFVQVSGEGVGALPQVYTLSAEGATVEENGSAIEIALEDHPTLGYTGRKADGSASRAMALNNHWIGARIGDLGIQNKESVSFGGWFKFNEIPDGQWNFLYICNKKEAWPKNEWGWSWCHGDKDGNIHLVFRGNSDGASPGEMHYEFPNFKVTAGVWTHLMLVCEEGSGNSFRAFLYVNGVRQESTWFQYTSGGSGNSIRYQNKTTEDWTTGMAYSRDEGAYLLFGGTPYNGVAIDGIVDDFQVWNCAMTAEQVKQSMNGFNKNNYPNGMLACWSFEDDCDDENYFSSFGAKSGVKAASLDQIPDPADTSDKADSEKQKVFGSVLPTFESGCPFLEGEAYPVVTEAVWKDAADRRTQFLEGDHDSGVTAGEEGSAMVTFNKNGDHNVTLTLKNSYGSDSKNFPVIKIVEDVQGLEGIAADGNDFEAFTEGNVLFLEFGQDGAYNVEVYNAAGVLVAAKTLEAVAGQNARVTLGTAGVYLVKASLNGKVLRTVKVLSK